MKDLKNRNKERLVVFSKTASPSIDFSNAGWGKRLGERVTKKTPDWAKNLLGVVDNPVTGEGAGSVFKGANPLEKLKTVLLGEKATSGPFAGKRLHPVKGPIEQSGRLVSKEIGEKIMSGALPGSVTVGEVGGKPVYYAKKFRPKGLAGVALRNPGKAGLAALAAYLLLKPENRQVAGSVVSGMAPSMPKGPTADVAKEWGQNQQSARPVLQQQAWG